MLLRNSKSLSGILWLVLGCCLLISAGDAYGQATSVTSEGFNATEGGGGNITWGWSTGNLGNSWAEGEWVPYQLTISNVQTDYPGLVGLPDIVMEYDFTAQNDARFVDLVRSIQVGTTSLTDAQGWPRDDGSAYPLSSSDRTLLEQAQNDFGNTAPLENTWPGFIQLNLPNSQVHRAAPPTYLDGTPDDAFRYFYITRQNLIDAGVDPNANTIIIYYQLHESRSFIWANSLQEYYDQDPTDDWGGYLYSLPAFAADVRNAAGYVPGSSGQIRVSFGGGDKTVPIPIPERLPGAVYGLKWFDENGNRIQDVGEQPLDGWRVFVKGTLEGINFADTTVTAGGGLYSFPNLTSGTTWFVYEDAQRFSPATTGWTQTYPILASTMGVASGWTVNPANPTYGAIGWQVPLTLSDTGQANLNFGNRQCTIEIVCPADTTLECTESTDTLYTGTPTVTANCGLASLVYSDSVVAGACAQEYTIYRRFIATDSTGLADTCVQMITVEDNNDPWITGVGADDTLECPASPVFSNPTAGDSCDSEVDLTHVDDTLAGGCAQEFAVRRIWTATDDCGNSVKDTQVIYIEDNTPPVVTCPDADSVECLADVPAPGGATAIDACDPDPTISFIGADTTGSCPTIITRYYAATDACGNADTCSQTIVVHDVTAPVLSGCPTDASYTCLDDVPAAANVTANDNCDGAITPVYTQIPENPVGNCDVTITRTWIATDDCGNADTCTQVITVDDDVAPVLSGCPTDARYECDETVPGPANVTANDNCEGAITPVFSQDSIPACGTTYTLIRTWIATDGCGNADTCEQTITVYDETPPVVTCPDGDTVQCLSDFPAPNIELVSATDNCDATPTITWIGDDAGTGTCPKVFLRGYAAVDDCGNADTCYQQIVVQDTTKPVLSGCPTDASYDCLADVPDPANVTANDNCDGPITPDFTQDPANPTSSCDLTITRMWVATDACGNADTCIQIITVDDDVAPVLSGCPGNTSYSCLADLPDPANVTANDNCDGPLTPSFDEQQTNPGSSCNNVITRTWIATDGCGNADTCVQVITVDDNTAPVLSGCPTDASYTCLADVPAPASVTANDNCDGSITPTYTQVPEVPVGNCDVTITRTWIATDRCGNADTCIQVITVDDDVAPVLSGCPAGDTVQCLADVPAPAEVTANDNCEGPITPTYSQVPEAPTTSCDLTITRTWIATDGCGNADTCIQVIRVDDTLKPVLSGCEPSDTVSCDETLPAMPTVTALDNCAGTLEPAFSQDSTAGDCYREYTLVRKWIATDLCGNKDSCMQTIWVVDTTAPVLTCAADDTIACEGTLTFTEPTVDDNCNDSIVVYVLSTDTTAGPGAGEYTYTRTWVAVDSCNLLADTCAQTILREACGGDFCTFTQGGWGNTCPESQQSNTYSTQPGCIRDHFFASVFPSGVIIGDPLGPGAGPGNRKAAIWTSAAAIADFLEAGGKPAILKYDYTNPKTTTAGVFAGQLLALKLNVGYSCAGILSIVYDEEIGCLGSYVINDSCGGQFAGITVDSFIVLADLVISGDLSVLTPFNAKISHMSDVATCLNERFNHCDPGAFSDQAAVKNGEETALPLTFSLAQNYPNPFNPVTEINYAVPAASHVTIEIFNVLGQKVVTLVDDTRGAGTYTVTWNAGNTASGIYFYRMVAGDYRETRKMLLLK